MREIAVYPFPQNPSNNLNLFPLELMEGKKVFHGTSSIYCNQIEQKGFQTGWSPFEGSQGTEFIGMLSDLGMPDTIGDDLSSRITINRYLENRKKSSLSFAFRGYEALFYSTGLRRGGQIYLGIQNALNWIDENDLKLNEQQQLLYDNLFSKIQEIQESRGCIYLLDLEEVNAVSYGVAINDIAGSFKAAFFREGFISSSRIIGKMFVPKEYVFDNDLLIKSVELTNHDAQTRGTFIYELFCLFMGFKEEE